MTHAPRPAEDPDEPVPAPRGDRRGKDARRLVGLVVLAGVVIVGLVWFLLYAIAN